MSKEALEAVIDDIRNFLSAQQSDETSVWSKEELINAAKQQSQFFLINLRYPRSLTLELLEDIVIILIDNPTATSSVVLELAQNTVYVAKEIESANIEQISTSRVVLLFYDLMIPVKIELDGELTLLMNKIDGEKIQILQHDKKGEVLLSFASIDSYLRTGESSSSYRKYNNLVGRIGIHSPNEFIIPSGVLSIKASDETVYATHAFLPIKYKSLTIPTIGDLNIDDLSTIGEKIKGLVINTNLHTNIFNPKFLLSLFEIDIDEEYHYQDIVVQPMTMAGAPQIKFLEPCKHISDLKILSLDDFEASYIYHDSYQAYCRICGERIPAFDEVVNVLDKSFGKNLTVFVNYKLFESLPYRNYTAVISYVISKNNIIEETLKINVSDSFLTVAKTIIDILLYHNSRSTMLAKEFSEEIRLRSVFFPRLTNQLFIQEVYEKEKYAEFKALNLTVLYLLCLLMLKPNFLIMLLTKFRKPVFHELVGKFLKRTKLVKDDMISVAIWLLDFYQQEKLIPTNLQKTVKAFQSNCKLLKNVSIDDIDGDIEHDAVTQIDDFPEDDIPNINRLQINNTISFFKPVTVIRAPMDSKVSDINAMTSIKMEKPMERLVPQKSKVEAMAIVKRLKPDMKFSYFYNGSPIDSFSIKSDRELIIVSTANKINQLINPYTDTKFAIEGNEIYDYLLAGEPLPTFETVDQIRLDSFIVSLKVALMKKEFKASVVDIEKVILEYITQTERIEDLMQLAVLVWSCFGYFID